MKTSKTKVVIIGGGPAGLMLSHCLYLHDIDHIVLEREDRRLVQRRIRAGVLEAGTVEFIRQVDLSKNMDRNGCEHDRVVFDWQDNRSCILELKKYTGLRMMAYGQSALTRDLYAAREKDGAQILDNASEVQLYDVTEASPYVTFMHEERKQRVDCDFICACDGQYGVGRATVPLTYCRQFEISYPFAWLGVLAQCPPLEDITYAHHGRGFALASHRGPTLSRYYIQVPDDTKVCEWGDNRLWNEIKARFPKETAAKINTGPITDKSIAPLRSFVSEQMRYGNLFLCGDAAHIVPPTGAKGLNLAMSDVFYLQRAFGAFFNNHNEYYLEAYSNTALRRVWSAMQCSWFLTKMLHVFPNYSAFKKKLQNQEYEHLLQSERAQSALCELYVGMPFE